MRSCQELWRVRRHARPVADLRFSPCGTLALSASHDGTLCVWQSGTGRLIHALDHGLAIRAADFARDGRVLAFCDDKTIHVWDPETGSRLQRFATLGRPGDYKGGGLGRRYPTAVTFSPGGDRVLIGTHDRTVHLCPVGGSARTRRFVGHAMPVAGVGFTSVDGPLWSFGQGEALRLWDRETRREIRRFGEGHLFAAHVPADCELVVTASLRGLRLWNGRTGDAMGRLSSGLLCPQAVFSLAGCETDRLLVCGTGRGEVEVWDLPKRKRLAHAKAHDGVVQQVACSSDGTRVLSAGGHANDVALWKLA